MRNAATCGMFLEAMTEILPTAPRWRRPLVLVTLLLLAYGLLSWSVAGIVIGAHHRPEVTTPADFGLEYESITLTSEDGVELQAWLVEPVEGPGPESWMRWDGGAPRGTVLVFHGIGGDRPAHYQYLLAHAGYRAIAVDHRAHGRSGGEICSFGWYERLDVEAGVTYARERWPGEPLGALGLSMGAAAIACAPSARDFDAIVLESVYADVDSAYRTRMDLYFPAWVHPLAWLSRQFVEVRLDASAEDLSPVDRLSEIDPSRLLMVRGADDELVSEGEYQRLRAAVPDAEWIVLEGRGHESFVPGAGQPYRQRVVSFLWKRMDGPR